MILITDQPIDTTAILGQVQSDCAGAVVLFLGTTRQWTDGRETRSLDYECYREMAEKKLQELAEEAGRRWEITGCAIIHRIGRLAIGEPSVAIAVSTPHREDAFAAGKWLIDTVKDVVPIWKKENWSDGTSQWVHPGADPTSQRTGGVETSRPPTASRRIAGQTAESSS